MNATLMQFVKTNNIVVTMITPKEEILLKGVTIPANLDETTVDLIRKVYGFDHYYSYSDDNRVWKAGESGYKTIKEKLAVLEDVNLLTLLSNAMAKCSSEALVEAFPWLDMSSTPLVRLVKQGLSVTDACAALAIGGYMRQQRDVVYDNQLQGYIVHSTKPEMVREHRTYEPSIPQGITVSKEMLTVWEGIGKLVQDEPARKILELAFPIRVERHAALGASLYSIYGVYLYL